MNIIKTLLTMSIAISVCIAQDINISGTVTGTGGTAIAGAAVQLEKLGFPTTTGADGSFTITGVGINSHINQPLPHMHIVSIGNGLLCINVQEKSAVEVITYTLQGKVISTIQKTMDVGTHSIALPHIGAGVYLYEVKIGGSEFVIKSHSIGRVQGGTAVSVHGSSSTALARHEMSYDPINDIIAVTKAGYLNYRVIVTNSDTNGIEIKMIVCADTVMDSDGNVYQAVKIGNQVWTFENLRTTRYNDGTTIPHVTDSAAWANDTLEAYCFYNNTTNADSIKRYGALYKWYTVDTKKLAPTGWHIPSDSEWYTLQNYLIASGYNWDSTTTGNKIAKSLAAKTDWNESSNTGEIGNELTKNNSSGFSALPGGYRDYNGSFHNKGYHGDWWSATKHIESHACYRYLYYDSNNLGRHYYFKSCGFSVRLVKD